MTQPTMQDTPTLAPPGELTLTRRDFEEVREVVMLKEASMPEPVKVRRVLYA